MAPKKPIKNITKPASTSEIKYQKKEKISNGPGAGRKIINFFSDERTRFILGTAVLIGVIFLLISFISYFIPIL